MTAMVSKEDAKAVYGRAFSRPLRLLFTNPVAFAFSLYYAYVYGMAVVLTLNKRLKLNFCRRYNLSFLGGFTSLVRQAAV